MSLCPPPVAAPVTAFVSTSCFIVLHLIRIILVMNFNDDLLFWLVRIIGRSGLSLLVISGGGGVSTASRTAQKIKAKWLKGKTFKYHRLLSIIGASLFLPNPISMIFAEQITSMQWFHIFVPSTAPKHAFADCDWDDGGFRAVDCYRARPST